MNDSYGLGQEKDYTENFDQVARLVFEKVGDGIVLSDFGGKILEANSAAERIFGYDPGALKGRSISDLLPQSMRAAHARWVDNYATGKESEIVGKGRRIGLTAPDGSPMHLAINVTPLGDHGVNGFVSIFRDISADVMRESNLIHQLHNDSLTGLPNQRSLLEFLKTCPEQGHQYHHGILAIIDLDHFSMINRTMGMSSGDSVLYELARRIRTIFHDADHVACLGGDRFSILFCNAEKFPDISLLGRLLIECISAPINVVDRTVSLSPSIGIVVFSSQEKEKRICVSMAEAAISAAKQQGGKRYIVKNEKDVENYKEQMKIEQNLHGAVARKEFRLVYQPQYNLITGRITGFEALVRWRNFNGIEVMPNDFIPIVEANGFIHDIGELVLDRGLQFLSFVHEMKANLTLAVNVSSVQISRDDFLANIANAIARYDLDPGLLELEITESAVMADPIDAVKKMKSVRAMGIAIAMDDFGVGQSSFAHLRKLPIDKLKLDRSLIPSNKSDLAGCAMVSGLVTIGQQLGLSVLAEGIETLEQDQLVYSLGCDKAQGYFYGRPLEEREAKKIVLNHVKDHIEGGTHSKKFEKVAGI